MKFTLLAATALFAVTLATPVQNGHRDIGSSSNLEAPSSKCKATCPGVCAMYGWDSGVCSGCYMNCRRDAPEELWTRKPKPVVEKRDVE